jgi:hypothetical protein
MLARQRSSSLFISSTFVDFSGLRSSSRRPHPRPSDWGAAAFVSQSLLASIITTFVLAVLILLLVPERQEFSREIIFGKEIGTCLKSAMTSTNFWLHKGSSGRYLRAEVAPTLARTARDSSSTRELRVQILDPDNENVCKAYAEYRRGLASASRDDEEWSQTRVREELLATILKLYILKTDSPLLDVELFLTSSFSVFRIDLSSGEVVVTTEDARDPAFRFSNTSDFYDAYRNEFNFTEKQAREIVLRSSGSHPATVDSNFLKALFPSIRISIDGLDESAWTRIIQKFSTSRNPYAH